MLETLIPNFNAEMARLHDIAPAGIILSFGWTFQGVEHVYTTYPEEWRQIYQERSYPVGDPVFVWLASRPSGETRWSEIRLPDLRGVLKHAKEFGLAYGIVVTRTTHRKRSFMALARSDRELTNSELNEAAAKFTTWTEMVLAKASLTEAELDVLASFRDGLGQRETAVRLGIAESTVKQRALRACTKLGAKSRTQAVAIAVERRYFAA